MSLALDNVKSDTNGADYSWRPVRNRLVAFKSAAIFLVCRAALRVKTRTPELGKKGNLLNTTLRAADLAYSKPIAIWSATIDGNWFRVSDAVVAAIVTGILLYSNQGMEPPAGKTRFQQWKNALKDPDQAAYFGMAVALHSAAISYGAMAWFMCNGRPEQWWQKRSTVSAISTPARAYFLRNYARLVTAICFGATGGREGCITRPRSSISTLAAG